MATINVSGSNITGFNADTAHSGVAFMGTTFDGNYNLTCVCRYKFTTDGLGATSVSFQTANATAAIQGVSTSEDSIGRMRFDITISDSTYINYKGNKGNAITDYSYAHYVKGSLSIKLLPNTTYYLWVFPASNFAGFTRFNLGDCTITTSGSYGNPSTITASNATIGSATSITLTNSVSGVTNTLEVLYGSSVIQTLLSNSSAMSVSWTPALATFCPLNTTGKTLSVTLRCTTFYSGTSWGTSTKTITLTIPSSAGPSISAVAMNYINTGTAAASISEYVQGYSKARATITANANFNASITGYSMTIDGTTVSGSSNILTTSAALTTSGTLTATIKVTDSRGYTASIKATVAVRAYAKPTLSGVSIFRCNASGGAADDGLFLLAKATGSASSVNGKNQITSLYVAIKASTDANYGTANPMSSGTAKLISGLDPDTTYTARITVTDTLGNSTIYTKSIPSRKWAMKFNSTGTAVGFGMAPQAANRLEIPNGWNVVRGTEQALFQTAARNEETKKLRVLNDTTQVQFGENTSHNAVYVRWYCGDGDDQWLYFPKNWNGRFQFLSTDAQGNQSSYTPFDDKADVTALAAYITTGSFSAAGITISAAGSVRDTLSCAKSGYTPIGIIGWEFSNTYGSLFKLTLEGNAVAYGLRNIHATSAINNATLTVTVLYKKT